MNKIQVDTTYYFIMLMLGSICFGHHYAHHQELTTASCLHLTSIQQQHENQTFYVVTNATVVSS